MKFTEIENKYRPIPFWSWNEKLDTEETRRQVHIMNEAGIGGYFMHARGGLLTEYMSEEWFDNVEAATDEGNSLGMFPWAYDENGWPSGFGGGKVNGLGEEYQQKVLHVEPFSESGEQNGKTVLVKNGYRYYYEVNPFYVDVLDKKVTERFIEEIYQAYYDKFGNRIKGFFTDEPQIYRTTGYPWSFPFIDLFAERYGYSLLDRINELFFDEGEYIKTRVDFWKLTTECFSLNFMKPIYDFCVSHGYQFTGHFACEDNMEVQLTSNGALMPHYEYFTIPGMDWLGRDVYDCLNAISVGSAAAQLGKKQVLAETYALAGHNVSHAELKRMYEWQMVRGVNLLCTHLEGYSLRGIRKRDYPPAMYYQQPWWSDMKQFFDSMSRVGKLLCEGRIPADTLVIQPQSTVWAIYDGYDNDKKEQTQNRINGYNEKLLQVIRKLEDKHIIFHLGDETLMMRHGSVVGSELVVGQMRYKKVIIPEYLYLLPETLALIEKFKAAGGVVTTADEIAPNPITEPSRLTYTKREYEDFDVHYFVNTDNMPLCATFSRGNLVLNIEDGTTSPFFGSYKFAPYESLVLIDTHDPREKMPEGKCLDTLSLLGEWRVKDTSYNSITLDRCDWSIDGGELHKNGYVLDILPRINELRREVKLYQRYKFVVKSIPEKLFLCTETPEIFEITLNGEPIDNTPVGSFIDTSFKLIDIVPLTRVGENVIEFRSSISQSEETYEHLSNSWAFESMKNTLSYDMEIEQIYVVGNFGSEISSGVEELPRDAYAITEPPHIAPMPEVVDVGRLSESGFAEFAGEIVLEKVISVTDTDKKVTLLGRGINSVALKVNGKHVATKLYPPYEVDISSYLKVGDNVFELTLKNNLRNMQGPFHHTDGELFWVTPASFYREACVFAPIEGKAYEACHDVRDDFTDKIQLVHMGLTE